MTDFDESAFDVAFNEALNSSDQYYARFLSAIYTDLRGHLRKRCTTTTAMLG